MGIFTYADWAEESQTYPFAQLNSFLLTIVLEPIFTQ